MAGIDAITSLINGALSILTVAKKAGPNGWSFSGTVLTINDQGLAAAVKAVLDKVNQVELEKELKDLNPFEVIKLANQVLALLPKILGASK